MTEAEKRKEKALQFQSDLEQMNQNLTTLGFLSADRQRLMTFYRWICFDKILRQQDKQQSEHLTQQFQTHLDDFHFAFTQGLNHIKMTSKKQEKIDTFWKHFKDLTRNTRT